MSTQVRTDVKSMSSIQAITAVSFIGLFEPPLVIPGFDKIVLKLLILITVILATAVVVTISSIVGVIRALLRTRRGGHSVAAVVLSAMATAITSFWLLYWVGDDIYHRSNPLNGILAINLVICLLPVSWLIAAIGANVAPRKTPP